MENSEIVKKAKRYYSELPSHAKERKGGFYLNELIKEIELSNLSYDCLSNDLESEGAELKATQKELADVEEWLDKEKQKTEWVSVTDRLPEKRQLRCLVVMHKRRTAIKTWAEVRNSNIFTWADDFGNPVSPDLFDSDKVTHWMPLPEPPNNTDREE